MLLLPGLDIGDLERIVRIGLDLIEQGPCIWTRRHVGTYQGRPFDQAERIYLARVRSFDPRPAPAALNEGFDAIRWWTLDQLKASTEDVAPRKLGDGIRALLVDSLPETPFDIGA